MSIQRVLVVDDDSFSREVLTEAVKGLGFHVDSCSTGEQAREAMGRTSIDLVFAGLRAPGTSGVDLVRSLSREFPDVPVVVVTPHGTVDAAVQAVQTGAADLLVKPCSPETIRLVVERLGRARRLQHENEYLRHEVNARHGQTLVAESPAMKELLKVAERAASSIEPVLITGESGTGKERIARFVHERSPRRDKPFVRVNCVALSEQGLESELFGHERGAGARGRREGCLELAEGGTLLLDEVGDASPAVQAKLLRVLVDREYVRVGGTSSLKADVRVIATTNRNLPKEVSEGSFREDLYHRLRALPMHVKPLRERREDIVPLARHFASFHARRSGLRPPVFSPEAESRIAEWNWPGNATELGSAIHRTVVLSEGAQVEPDHLLFEPMPRVDRRPKFTLVTDKGDYLGVISASSPLANRQLADLEREAILCTLEATRGNKTEAARRLGVTARTLSNKMKLWRELGLVA